MAKPPTTSAEALQTQFLEDMDALLMRLERLQENLSADIVDATNKSLLAARLNFEESISKQRMELHRTGKEVAAEIRESLNQVQQNILPAGQGRRGLGLLLLISSAAGIAGGAIVSLLAG